MARDRRVLLVEGDLATAGRYLEQLRKDGVPVEHVASASAADQFLQSRRPVLALVDVCGSDIRSRQLVESWAADPQLGGIPVWIVGDADGRDDLWWHRAPNVQRFFLKSRISLARLSVEIRATLGLPYGDRLLNRRAAG